MTTWSTGTAISALFSTYCDDNVPLVVSGLCTTGYSRKRDVCMVTTFPF